MERAFYDNGPEGDQRRTEESPENRRAQLKFEQREKAKKLGETEASLVKTEDPSEVLSEAGLAELRKAERSGEPLKGKTFEMKDGRICRYMLKFEKEYTFRLP